MKSITVRLDRGDLEITLDDILQMIFQEAMNQTETVQGGKSTYAFIYFSEASRALIRIKNEIKAQYERYQRESGVAQPQHPTAWDPSPWLYQQLPEQWVTTLQRVQVDLESIFLNLSESGKAHTAIRIIAEDYKITI